MGLVNKIKNTVLAFGLALTIGGCDPGIETVPPYTMPDASTSSVPAPSPTPTPTPTPSPTPTPTPTPSPTLLDNLFATNVKMPKPYVKYIFDGSLIEKSVQMYLDHGSAILSNGSFYRFYDFNNSIMGGFGSDSTEKLEDIIFKDDVQGKLFVIFSDSTSSKIRTSWITPYNILPGAHWDYDSSHDSIKGETFKATYIDVFLEDNLFFSAELDLSNEKVISFIDLSETSELNGRNHSSMPVNKTVINNAEYLAHSKDAIIFKRGNTVMGYHISSNQSFSLGFDSSDVGVKLLGIYGNFALLTRSDEYVWSHGLVPSSNGDIPGASSSSSSGLLTANSYYALFQNGNYLNYDTIPCSGPQAAVKVIANKVFNNPEIHNLVDSEDMSSFVIQDGNAHYLLSLNETSSQLQDITSSVSSNFSGSEDLIYHGNNGFVDVFQYHGYTLITQEKGKVAVSSDQLYNVSGPLLVLPGLVVDTGANVIQKIPLGDVVKDAQNDAFANLINNFREDNGLYISGTLFEENAFYGQIKNHPELNDILVTQKNNNIYKLSNHITGTDLLGIIIDDEYHNYGFLNTSPPTFYLKSKSKLFSLIVGFD